VKYTLTSRWAEIKFSVEKKGNFPGSRSIPKKQAIEEGE